MNIFAEEGKRIWAAKMAAVPSRKHCPICKFKIRGRNHENGSHHQKAIAAAKKGA